MFSCMCILLAIVGSLSVAASDTTALLSLSHDMTNKPPSWRSHVSPCQWLGVCCNATGYLCEPTGVVTEIHWWSLGLGGSANLSLLPQGLQILSLFNNTLRGTPNLSALPEGLQELGLGSNQMTGTPDLATLPHALIQLRLHDNDFRGRGTLGTSHPWCVTPQVKMCGAHDGVFQCSSGVWSCDGN